MVKFFPALIVGLSVAASLTYGWHGDIRHCLYWAFSAGIGVVVSF